MKMIRLTTTTAALLIACSAALRAEGGAPKGWMLQESKPSEYTVKADSEQKSAHGKVVLIESRDASKGNATLMQAIKADDYRGKRVRFSGYIKGKGVAGWAGLWMRVNDIDNRVTVFDNTEKRGFHGDGDWKKMDVVLDIPSESGTISFGALLSGPGRIWVSGFEFQVVDESVPVTAKPFAPAMSKAPINLGLE